MVERGRGEVKKKQYEKANSKNISHHAHHEHSGHPEYLGANA